MFMPPDRIDQSAKAQFEEAVRRLEAAQARVQALSTNPFADENTRRVADEAYERARLLWLSSEVVLRSLSIVQPPLRDSQRNILIAAGNTHVAESIALLLRLRGYRATVVSDDPAACQAVHPPAFAVILDIEHRFDKICKLAVKRLKTAASTKMIAMIPPEFGDSSLREFDVVLVKPATTDMILDALLRDARR